MKDDGLDTCVNTLWEFGGETNLVKAGNVAQWSSSSLTCQDRGFDAYNGVGVKVGEEKQRERTKEEEERENMNF